MDALEFLRERKRMCKSFNKCSDGCPAWTGSCKFETGIVFEWEADKQVEIVKEWAAAHPRKTRQSVFLEQFPNAPIYTNTHNIALDPCTVDTTLRGHCPTGRGCDTCRREFWGQEVE